MVNTFLDGLAQSQSFALTGDNDDDFPAVQNGLNADCECHVRDGRDVIVEEPRIGEDGVICEGLDPGARFEGGSGFLSDSTL